MTLATLPPLPVLPVAGSVWVPGRPQAASRPKVTVRGGRARAYYPQSHLDYEQKCMVFLRAGWSVGPVIGPVALELRAVFPRPSNRTPRSAGGTLSTTGERELALTCGLESAYGSLPAFSEAQDVDNLAKLVMDALQKAGVYRNDSRVVSCIVTKEWAPLGSVECGMHVTQRQQRQQTIHIQPKEIANGDA